MADDGNVQKFGAVEACRTSARDLATIRQPDSIAVTIEEGYGRLCRKEHAQFLVISRGSIQENKGRSGRFKHWLPQSVIEIRMALCHEIVGILSKPIGTLRRSD